MLQLRNVTITHRKDLRVILKDFSLVLNHGDKAVIIGEEGNGKSTLLKWIFDPMMVEAYVEAEGERSLGKERLGYLPQELPESDKDKTVYEYFADSDAFFEESVRDLSLLANRFHVDSEFFYRDQKMCSLSGGEKIKAQLMRIFMESPTVLLLDEPSNDIDLETLELLETIINEWKYIVLFISHDETLIENTANMVIHLELIKRKTEGRYTVAKMPYQKYVEERLHLFTRQTQQAVSERKEKKIREEKYRRVLDSVDHALNTVSRQSPAEAKNLKDKMHSVKAMGKRFAREDENMTEFPQQEEAIYFTIGNDDSYLPGGKTVIEYDLDELKVTDDDRILAKDISLVVRGAEKICIIGRNGVGKTTLIRKIAEELLAREDIRVQYMPQNYEDLLDPEQTVVDYLDESGEREERTRIRTFLGSLRYTTDEMDHPIKELSGGQKAKIFLIRMALSDVNVLVLDEPTRNFSPLSNPVIRKMLKEFPGAIISISHDRKYIDEVCDRVYELKEDGLHLKQ